MHFQNKYPNLCQLEGLPTTLRASKIGLKFIYPDQLVLLLAFHNCNYILSLKGVMFLDVVLSIVKNKSTKTTMMDFEDTYFEWKIEDFDKIALKWIDFLVSLVDLRQTDVTKYIKRMYACDSSNCVEMYKNKVRVMFYFV